MHLDLNSTLVGMAALWIFSAVVNGMPAPAATSSLGYRWLYGSLQFLGSNLSRISSGVPPPSTVSTSVTLSTSTTTQKAAE